MPRKITDIFRRAFACLLTVAIVATTMGVASPALSAGETSSAATASASKKKSSKKKKSTSKKKKNSRRKTSRKKRRSRKNRRHSRTRVHTRRTPLVIRGTTGVQPQCDPFVIVDREDSITAGLEGRNIAVWASHGLYYAPARNRWEWQRPRLFTTVEDLLSTTFVYPYLIPMLENAGAYVMTPRERDASPHEAIADASRSHNGSFATTDGRRHWETTPDSTGYLMPEGAIYGTANPFHAGNALTVATVGEDTPDDEVSTASWSVTMPERGRYAVYVTYPDNPAAAPDVTYTINHLGGSTEVNVNQTMGAGTWIYLGTYDIAAGDTGQPLVELTNISTVPGTVVSADAVKVGGGIGNVAWSAPGGYPFTSGARRYNEGASTYLRGAGMPEGVWNASQGESLYKNDYMSRAHWANYLAGGSPILPDTTGLRIPVDMAFAFHTDAGISDSVVGSLALYSTDDGNPLGNGSSREANADLANGVLQSVTADIRATYDPTWNSRGSRDRKYYEVRETKMPAMILEALSHQNFIDMQRAHDPEFKFVLSRAIYKAILRFLASRYGTEAVVQPLPVSGFSIAHKGKGKYLLSWEPVPDPLEPTAAPTYYIIEERLDDGGFQRLDATDVPAYEVEISDDRIHSYRITAANDGGMSFPSEVLSLYDHNGEVPEVTVVNGFTRVSAPAADETGHGFDLADDPGVADGINLGTVGPQFDFERSSAFVGNDFPGWGNSRGNLERQRIIGNTHDYTAIHGRAIRATGRGYVSSSAAAFEKDPRPVKTQMVDFIGGLQKAGRRAGSGEIRHTLMSPLMRARLADHVDRGGSLLVSGSYIPSELMKNEMADSLERLSTQRFGAETLGLQSAVEKAAVTGDIRVAPEENWTFRPNIYTIPTVINNNTYSVTAPESPYPSAAASVVMRFEENGLPAGIAYRPLSPDTGAEGRVVTLGFPLETVTDPALADQLMADILTYLLEYHSDKKQR